MTKHIRLMAEYNGHSLWNLDPSSLGPIDPEVLPLKRETVLRLLKWSEKYNNHLNWDDPAKTKPWMPEELREFEEEGVRLWLMLREELYPEFEVEYYSEAMHRHLKNPSELTYRK
jgi:hypothetical protein